MADITVTAGSVVVVELFDFVDGLAGETITAGQALYLKASDSAYWKADANSGTAEVRVLAGIALNGASAGQHVRVMKSGTINIGGTVAVGTIYVLSATAGGIAPTTDLVTGWYTSIVGVATTAANIKLAILNSGVAVP